MESQILFNKDILILPMKVGLEETVFFLSYASLSVGLFITGPKRCSYNNMTCYIKSARGPILARTKAVDSPLETLRPSPT